MTFQLNYAVRLLRDRQFETAPNEETIVFSGSVVHALTEYHSEELNEMVYKCRTRNGYEFEIDQYSVEVLGSMG